MSRTYFIFSDVHSFFNELQEALNAAGFDIGNQDHVIISCGDILDRGRQSRECLQFVNKLQGQNRAILIEGNHDTLFKEMIERNYPETFDYRNGTFQTLVDLCEKAYTPQEAFHKIKEDRDYNEYVSHLRNYYETDNYIFTHAGLPITVKPKGNKKMSDYTPKYDTFYNPKWRNAADKEWDDYPNGAKWLNPFQFEELGLNETGKKIVHGHWHNSSYWAQKEHISEWGEDAKFDIAYHGNCIGLDACTAFTHKVNVLVLKEEDI